jgi:hypothetical protein
VWGCIGHSYKSPLVICGSSIKAPDYINILDGFLLPDLVPGFTFQQDNARPHTAHMTTNWLEGNCVDVLPWPAYSPDLNPIENLWGLMTITIFKSGKQCTTVEELQDVVLATRLAVDQESINRMIASIPGRLQAVVDAHGYTIDT